ncbi:glutamate--tRNA ligase [Iamia sp. SCSIO 61187]|uniref:glutamate--tRNA ligase n=1 Tax=Iamia sp. SCSIO 61187 TaxID=2722752 RepID=UPI001C636CEB|nr:glutamate--tRNA ligase [Iamia sp. SCSIO 61187]QYG94504.1 glutamate--tRNA ligase [Iamia sp. SCSIO 61187]
MPDAPVVRFAPSPTGFLHVGSAHSALANWLVARRAGGRFLLRIEDTDAERNRPELIENVLEMLRWLGLDWDGEPVHQSDRTDDHRAMALKLAADGQAYWCDCTAEQVQARAQERGGPPGYDGFCRDRGLERGEATALRFRRPEGTTAWTDLVRGEVSFANDSLEDFVLLRSNGSPVFLLANALDDAHMGITHVIRGEDHVNGTPKYLMILRALGLPEPVAFAHMPLLVNEGRKKLSKRRDDVSVADYRAEGFLPEGMVNYLALLGWGPPDGVEVRPVREIVDLYDLAQVNPSPAFFDRKKLLHVNAEWIRRLPLDDFVARAGAFLPHDEARAALASIGPLVQERVRTLGEVAEMVDFLWLAEPPTDEADWDKVVVRGKASGPMLDASVTELRALDDGDGWTAAAISAAVERAATTAGITKEDGSPQMAKASGPVRVATTGRRVGPPLWESLEALGRERTLVRLDAARARLG